jgi:hypothetical protein
MRNLESRIERLEQEAGTAEPLTVICASFDPGELRGYRTVRGNVETIRSAGEDDRALLRRAERSTIPQNGVLTLREIRG